MAPDLRPAKVREVFAERVMRRSPTMRGFETVELWFEHDLLRPAPARPGARPAAPARPARRRDPRPGGRAISAGTVPRRSGASRSAPSPSPRPCWPRRCGPGRRSRRRRRRQPSSSCGRVRPSSLPDRMLASCRSCARALRRWLEDLPGARRAGPVGAADPPRGAGRRRAARPALRALLGHGGRPSSRATSASSSGSTGSRSGRSRSWRAWPIRCCPTGRRARPRRSSRSRLALTAAGEAVLAGRADHVALNGIDRWWGGTHLEGSQVWRWIDGALAQP